MRRTIASLTSAPRKIATGLFVLVGVGAVLVGLVDCVGSFTVFGPGIEGALPFEGRA